jgi:flagellin FlaB
MKANRSIKNDRAEVGVGTLIVFIAMVLVAAVAAAVLINTTGTLQQRAQSTGKEATQEVSSNLKVINVYGVRTAHDVNNAMAANLWDCQVNVELSAGALPMDLSKLIIRYSDGTNTRTYDYNVATLASNATASTHFEPTWIRGSGTSVVMNAGDLVQLHFNNCNVGPRTSVAVQLIPETGSPVDADFKTPATYGSDTTITLR